MRELESGFDVEGDILGVERHPSLRALQTVSCHVIPSCLAWRGIDSARRQGPGPGHREISLCRTWAENRV